ncbi:MAG TPA: efflux RND transporter periplasmic adaptor subunit [Rubricoccaceae bacterium]
MNVVTRGAASPWLALPLLLALTACGGGEEAPDPAAETEARTLVLAASDVATVQRGTVQAGVQITGTLDPYQTVEVKSQIGGTLGSVRYDEGDRVGRGAVMATIVAEGIRSQTAATRAGVGTARAGVGTARAGVGTARAGVTSAAATVASARAAVAAAEAQLALARQQAASARLLFTEGALSRLEDQAAQAQVEAAQAQLASARAGLTSAQSQVTASQGQVTAAQGQVTSAQGQVASAQSQATSASEQASRTIVRAPFSGAVSARQVELGEAVTSGQTLFTVVNSSALELAGQVGVADVGRISVGDPVQFQIDAYPDQDFRGVVSRIDPTADPETRQVGVYLRMPNPSGLVGGLFATGTVLAETISDALLVPESAVRTRRRGDSEQTYVLVIDGGVLRERPVGVVQRDEARGVVAIQGEGIGAGDRVVVAPTTDAVDGARVRVAAPRTAPRATPRPSRPDSAAVRNDG